MKVRNPNHWITREFLVFFTKVLNLLLIVTKSFASLVVTGTKPSAQYSFGTISPKDSYSITSMADGEVVEADFEEGDKVTEGPDSNFSIWNAGGYIFGYNEIDTTMERDRTEEDRQGDIAWETKMLEIMSWLTDDVDWITGMCHENIRRICWHN